jgi:prepilin-type N-terminal cleavage/methylation domain-containing protein
MTLVELIVSLAIISILSAMASGFLIGGIKFFRLTAAKGEIQRDVRQSVDLINRTLRQGQADTVSISRIDSTQPPCSLIQFTSINGSEYHFYQQNNQLFSGSRPAPGTGTWQDHLTAGNLRLLSFMYPRTDDESIVSVSLCFEKATYQGSSKTLQLSVEKIRIMN